LYLFLKEPDQIKLSPYTSGVATAFEMVRRDIEGLFEIGVLVLGGLWGVGIVKKEERLRRRDWPEIIMFASATFLLAAFLYLADQYSGMLELLYWNGQPLGLRQQAPDLFGSPYIRLYHISVHLAFYAGLFASAIATFSICLLREGHHG
jgi:hypothetical protein